MLAKSGQVLKLFFCFGLFLLPLVFWPLASIPYEIPRVFFIKRWVEILAILTMIFAPILPKRKRVDKILVLLVSLFVLSTFISSVQGMDFAKSFWGNYYRNDGLLTLFHLAAFFFFLTLFWEKSWWKPTTTAISLGCLSTSLWTILSGIRNFGLPVAISFGNPNFLAGYLLVGLPFLSFLATSVTTRKERLFWLLALVCQIVAIGLTFSRSAVLGLLLFFLVWLALKKAKKIAWFWLMPIVLVLGACFLILISSSLRNMREWGKSNIRDYVAESRERIYIKGLLAWQKRPFWGWGWANFDYAFESIDWPGKFKTDVYVDKAHSSILEVLVTTGLVGLFIYLLILGRVFKNLYCGLVNHNLYSMTLLLVLFLYLFHSQTNVVSMAEELIFWLVLGLIATSDKSDQKSQLR